MAEPAATPRADGGATPVPAFLTATLRRLLALVVFAMMALIFVGVFMRYVFNSPIPGAFEIVQFMLAFMIFTALPLVTLSDGHIVVSLFQGFFVGRRGFIQRVGVMLVSVACLILIAFLMWHQAHSLRSSKQVTGFLEWPIYPIAYVMCALSVVAVGVQLVMLCYLLWRRPTGQAHDGTYPKAKEGPTV